MKDIFRKVMMSKPPRSTFNLSHDVKMSFNMGDLIPTCAIDVLPGDFFEIGVENMMRFAPLVSPVMHQVNITTHYFFVPNRILWSEWEDWIIGESNVLPPTFNMSGNEGITEGSLGDYMGLPTINRGYAINALPFAAYNKIWNEYYRDNNLQSEITDTVSPGNNATMTTAAQDTPQKRAWMHDYFTSALPNAQQGAEVEIPLVNQTVPVTLDPNNTTPWQVENAATGAGIGNVTLSTGADALLEGSGTDAQLDPQGSLVVDINSQATDITTLRTSFRLQEWLEKNMRGGRRYIEQIMTHFGQKSSDARLNRPEYIGGSKQRMVISEVLSTAQTVDQSSNDIPVGNLAGHGISVGGGNKWKYKAEEHGWIIGIVNVQPTTAYSQGVHRKFTRDDKLDYAWPTFANIGEQPILSQEVYGDQGVAGTGKEVFGYVPRYSEYKYENNRIAGQMRTDLEHWHLGRRFTTRPALNEAFIQADPSKRIFAVTDPDEDTIYAQIYNNIRVNRALPKYGIPSI